jgi:CheY-like chemotaxis protein
MGRGEAFVVESLSGTYALVLDAEEEQRALVGGILRYCGALVTPADTPAAALAIMRLLKPDVVVVAFTRPEDGGLEFIRSVRAMKPEEGGMVAAIAVGEGGANAALARSRGYDAYVAKPLDPWELCRVVASLVLP